MVKALTQNPSDRSNLFHLPAIYKVVARRLSPYITSPYYTPFLMNLGHWVEIRCATIRKWKIRNARKGKHGGKNVVAWSLSGYIVF